MDNDDGNQQQAGEEYKQEFISELRKSSQDAKNAHEERRKKRIMIIVICAVLGALAVLLMIIGIVVLRHNRDGEIVNDDDSSNEFFDAETSMVGILVSPSTAKIMINEEQYTNGEYEIEPGEYAVSITADGFETYDGVVIISDKHKTYVATCLRPLAGNEEYYNEHSDERQICRSADELTDVAAWDQNALTDEIFEYTPFHNDAEGFYVDPYYNDEGKLIVELTFKDCAQNESVLENKAYDWMREQKLEPSEYVFEKTWDCED